MNYREILQEEAEAMVQERIVVMQARVKEEFFEEGFLVTVRDFDLDSGQYDFEVDVMPVGPFSPIWNHTGTLASLTDIILWDD